MEEEDRLTLLLDIDSILYYEAHKEKLIDAIEGIDTRMQRIFSENNTNRYIAFLTEGRCFRYAKATTKDYKGSRKTYKPRWFYVLKDYLKARYGAFSIDGIEADDAVAYFDSKILNTRICSPDKDVLKQCAGTHYNYQMVKGTTPGTFHSKGMITTTLEESNKFLYTQMLMGDSTDGISGIEKVGEKTAEKLLANYSGESPEGDIEQMILSEYIKKYGKVDGISRFGETFKLVYLLKTDEDMMREIKYIPEVPEVSEYISEEESMPLEDTTDWN